MAVNLLSPSWCEMDDAEVRFVVNEIIGGPGQYYGLEENPNTFYQPLAGQSCQIKLEFSTNSKRLVSVEPGPSFDAKKWCIVVSEIESQVPLKTGRDISFCGFRVEGSWRGEKSGVQILPPPVEAPKADVELADHPFILEFPVKAGDNWPITNFRRNRQHQRLTFLLNVLLAGGTTIQSRRSRNFWASVRDESSVFGSVKWVQEFYFVPFGEAVQNELSSTNVGPMEIVDSETYYASVGHDGRPLRIPSDLDESICSYLGLTRRRRDKFVRAGFWLDLASRQWTLSLSAVFASLVSAIEALTEDGRNNRAAKFRNFIERYVPGGSLEARRSEMYDLRSEILHGSGLMEMDQGSDFGWAPPEQREKDLLNELWRLTRFAMRSWLKDPTTAE